MPIQTYYDRADIKSQAKSAMKKQRGISIGLCLLPMILSFVVSFTSAMQNFSFPLESHYYNYTAIIPFIMRMSVVPILLSLLLSLLMIAIGGCYTKIFREEKIGFEEAISIMSNRVGRKIGTSLLTSLYTFLWSLLFIIPGIMKAYSYAMVPYLLAEYPEIPANKVIQMSSRMMKGYRFKYFVMELSFFGWMLLSPLTFGILLLVYVNPYMYTAQAGFYTTMRDIALENGVIDPSEFKEQ